LRALAFSAGGDGGQAGEKNLGYGDRGGLGLGRKKMTISRALLGATVALVIAIWK
jgi:hypothetical protein